MIGNSFDHCRSSKKTTTKGFVDSTVSSGPVVKGSVKRQVCASQNIYSSPKQNLGLRQQFHNLSAHAY
jgi:hypothetical protein